MSNDASHSLSSTRSIYESLSATAGEQSRKLAYVGIAVVWLYRTTIQPSSETQPEYDVPKELRFVLLCLALSLGLDLLQYVVGTAVWFNIFRSREINLSRESDPEARNGTFLVKAGTNSPAWFLWCVKILCCVLGWFCLVLFVSVDLFR